MVDEYLLSAIYSVPLLQVLSIEIKASKEEDEKTLIGPLELNGKIFVRDNKEVYLLYKRKKSNWDRVDLGSSLKLNPWDLVIPAHRGMYFGAELNVRNASGSNLDKKSVLLEFDVENHNETRMFSKLNGAGYDIVLEYFVLQFAVTGVVRSVELENSSKPFDGGKLFASYVDNCKLKEEEFEYPEIELHDFKTKPLGPQTESDFELESNRVAVPSHSSLLIKFVPHDGGEEKSHTFDPFEDTVDDTLFSVGDISLKVTVDWSVTRWADISTRKLPLKDDSFLWKRELDDSRFELIRSHFSAGPKMMVEVCSIFIGCKSTQSVEIFGTIKLYSGKDEYYLFNRGENEAEELSGSKKMLPIEGPPRHSARPPFWLVMDLKDKQSSLNIKGDSCLYDASFRHERRLPNRPLLNVFRGNFGYAAVHYMMFPESFSASIEVEAVGQHSTDVTRHVRGSIYAYYGIYSYDTEYDREFYRSLLFKDDSARELTVKEGKCRIPLRKNLVSIDYRSSLFLDINLAMEIVTEKGMTNEVSFKGEMEFKPPKQSKTIRCNCQDESLVIIVTWVLPKCLKGCGDILFSV